MRSSICTAESPERNSTSPSLPKSRPRRSNKRDTPTATAPSLPPSASVDTRRSLLLLSSDPPRAAPSLLLALLLAPCIQPSPFPMHECIQPISTCSVRPHCPPWRDGTQSKFVAQFCSPQAQRSGADVDEQPTAVRWVQSMRAADALAGDKKRHGGTQRAAPSSTTLLCFFRGCFFFLCRSRALVCCVM